MDICNQSSEEDKPQVQGSSYSKIDSSHFVQFSKKHVYKPIHTSL